MNELKSKPGKNSLESRIFRESILPHCIAAAFIFLYSGYFVGFSLTEMIIAAVVVLVIVMAAQFGLSPVTNLLFTRPLSVRIEQWEKHGLDEAGRTRLLADLMNYPKYRSFETTLYFSGCAVVLSLGYHFLPFIDVDPIQNIMSFLACMLGAYNAGLLSLSYSERICSSFACRITAQGVDEKTVRSRKYFGISMTGLFIRFLILPVVFTNIISFLALWKGYLSWNGKPLPAGQTQISLMIFISIFNICLTGLLSYIFYRKVRTSNKTMEAALDEMIASTAGDAELVPTDLENEMSYTIHLVNKTICLFRDIIIKAENIGKEVLDSTQNLVVISSETASTSLEQAAGVKEIVGAMEDSDKLSRNISGKISDVADVAFKTSDNVHEGVETLSVNLEKMHEITESNIKTIEGIKALSSKIDSIWEIVSLINNIADQTKIIAFNAELEAASAGDAGRNFHIVANEIRRLADSTMESTKEIKKRITEIQHSSDTLIVTSEGGTERINEGCALTAKLEQNFEDIKNSATVTAESSREIKLIIDQQTAAFEQIIITLREMSAGIDCFTDTTRTINESSMQLKQIADRLAVIGSAAAEN